MQIRTKNSRIGYSKQKGSCSYVPCKKEVARTVALKKASLRALLKAPLQAEAEPFITVVDFISIKDFPRHGQTVTGKVAPKGRRKRDIQNKLIPCNPLPPRPPTPWSAPIAYDAVGTADRWVVLSHTIFASSNCAGPLFAVPLPRKSR